MNHIKLKLAACIFLTAAMSVYGAITEHYVTASGSAAWANSSDIAQPSSWANMLTGAAAGDRCNIKAGSYSFSSSDVFTNVGTATDPIILRGYSSAIGDGNLGRTNGNGAIITTNMPTVTYSGTGFLTVPVFTLVESMNITSPKTASSTLVTGANCVVKSCNIVNSGASNGTLNTGANAVIFDNDLTLTSGSSSGTNALGLSASGVAVINNRIKPSGTSGGFMSSGGGASQAVIGNVIIMSNTSGGNGIFINNTTAVPIIYGNTIVGATGDGINVITASTIMHCIVNNLITDNLSSGINMVSTGNAGLLAYNRLARNTTAPVSNGGDWVTATNYVANTASTSDYTNSGSGDYSLLSTSPAKGAGWFQYLDIGALQRLEPTGITRIPSIGQ